MKKGTRNNIILWSIISFVVLFPVLWMIIEKQNRVAKLTESKQKWSSNEERRAARLKWEQEQVAKGQFLPDQYTSKIKSDNAMAKAEVQAKAKAHAKATAETQATNKLSHKNIVYSARYAVRHYLLSPSYDSFPVWPDNSYGVTTLENNTYLVSGKVTAKNAFGVKLQNTWITKLKFSGSNLETVRATYVKIGDKVLLDVP